MGRFIDVPVTQAGEAIRREMAITPSGRLRLVSSMALRISCVTASGRDTIDACNAAWNGRRRLLRMAANRRLQHASVGV